MISSPWMRTRSKTLGLARHESSAGAAVDRVDLITRVCKLPAGLLVILEPRRFLRFVDQSITASG